MSAPLHRGPTEREKKSPKPDSYPIAKFAAKSSKKTGEFVTARSKIPRSFLRTDFGSVTTIRNPLRLKLIGPKRKVLEVFSSGALKPTITSELAEEENSRCAMLLDRLGFPIGLCLHPGRRRLLLLLRRQMVLRQPKDQTQLTQHLIQLVAHPIHPIM